MKLQVKYIVLDFTTALTAVGNITPNVSDLAKKKADYHEKYKMLKINI